MVFLKDCPWANGGLGPHPSVVLPPEVGLGRNAAGNGLWDR
jgi:hypothetical protein